MQRSEVEGKIHGCKVARRATIVSHLFFADDSFLFYRSNLEECSQLKLILSQYQEASRQTVNFNKSTVYFSRNTSIEVKQAICEELHIVEEEAQFLYSGISVGVGCKKKEVFSYLGDRIWKLIDSWQKRALSKAGKELQIKAVM